MKENYLITNKPSTTFVLAFLGFTRIPNCCFIKCSGIEFIYCFILHIFGIYLVIKPLSISIEKKKCMFLTNLIHHIHRFFCKNT